MEEHIADIAIHEQCYEISNIAFHEQCYEISNMYLSNVKKTLSRRLELSSTQSTIFIGLPVPLQCRQQQDHEADQDQDHNR